MEHEYYFDMAATTPIKKEVAEAMKPWITTLYGNPSSPYVIGIKSHMAIEVARSIIARMIGADSSEIFFTSGGSEANTWAMTCVKKGFNCFKHGRVLISPIEHHSILHAVPDADYCDINPFGRVETNSLIDKIKPETYLISTMYVNNEIGTIEPIDKIAFFCAKEGLFCHVDAVQAFGHIPINVKEGNFQGITTMSASAHKIGGPKGIGFLYIRKDIQPYYKPLIYGGKQEMGMRGGTENVAAIVGFAKACELAEQEIHIQSAQRDLGSYTWDFIKDNVPNVHLNGYPLADSRRVPNIINISIEGINGEELVSYLNDKDIYISTGSACNTGSDEPSHVLKAIGLSNDLANGSIRISFGKDITLLDVNILCQNIIQGVELLRG